MSLNLNTMNEIKNMLITSIEAAEFSLKMLHSENYDTFILLIADLEAVIESVHDTLNSSTGIAQISQSFNIIVNIMHSIQSMKNKINSGNKRRGEIILEFEIIPLLQELKEDLYFFTLVYPNKTKMDEYYKYEFAQNHANIYVRDNKIKYEISLVVVSWNKLEYTKKCIESLLKYTDLQGLSYELITINHGSSDDTEKYYESLPNEKKLNFKKNMCMAIGSLQLRVTEGKYVVLINNDVVLTPNWLSNMIKCIKSDNKIACACPTTPNISNLQAIPESYSTLVEMQKFAKKFNVSNPDLWDERIKLCPPVLIMNMDIVNKLGYSDRYFRFMEYGDDNAGLVYRRNGYKQIHLRDTFCHHFGSVTLGEAQKKNNTLEISRKLFIEKHNLDPWGSGFVYDVNVIQVLDYNKSNHVDILGIDSGLGSTPLQIKNELRHKGIRDVALYNFTTELQYEQDLIQYSDYFYNSCINDINSFFPETKFDYIYIGKPVEDYEDYNNLIKNLRDKLKDGGQIAFKVSNMFFLQNIAAMINLSIPNNRTVVRYINIDNLRNMLTQMFSTVKTIFLQSALDTRANELCNTLLTYKNNDKNAEVLFKTSEVLFLLIK